MDTHGSQGFDAWRLRQASRLAMCCALSCRARTSLLAVIITDTNIEGVRSCLIRGTFGAIVFFSIQHVYYRIIEGMRTLSGSPQTEIHRNLQNTAFEEQFQTQDLYLARR